MDKLLESVRHLQVKPKNLKCTVSSTCWCNNISFRFIHQPLELCMSPAEMLETAGSEMNEKDKKYLNTLIGYKFDSTSV